MKRPFAELDVEKLNARVAPPEKVHASLTPRGTSACLSDRFIRRSLGRTRLNISCFHEIDRLESLNLSWYPSESRDLGGNEGGIPFAMSTANTCSLTAIGHESGLVRVYDHDPSPNRAAATDTFIIHPHRNAVFNIQWSADDKRLLTASGDQSACLLDVQTQKLIAVLSRGHTSTIKDVRFDPLNAHICATSARDGSIAIWDTRLLRDTPVLNWASLDATDEQSQAVCAPPVVGCIPEAHGLGKKGSRALPAPSITAMLYGPNGHLITACSANPMLKTWDLRYLRAARTSGNAGYYPLLQTSFARPQKNLADEKLAYGTTAPLPAGPRRQRTYGVASLALSHDGQRLYSVNRDNKVYEYVTSHPHLGPTKVFDVPDLQVKTFYCKSSISKDDFLVCGNYSGSPVVIDTRKSGNVELDTSIRDDPANDQENRSVFSHSKSPLADRRRKVGNNVPCSRLLAHGHDLEVTGVAWSFDSSSFVSISDDRTARLWRRHE